MSVARRALLAALLVAPAVAHAADPDAVAPISSLDEGLLAVMRAGKATPFAKRYQTLAPIVERAFDLPVILRASVGLRWSTLQPAEKTQLLDVFRQFTVCSYVANFDSYGGEKIEVLPGSRMIGQDQVVETQISGSGDTARIDYLMHRTADGWRAIDVLLNGSISQVAVNRSDWRTLLSSGAGALIAQLRRKVADLSGGAIR